MVASTAPRGSASRFGAASATAVLRKERDVAGPLQAGWTLEETMLPGNTVGCGRPSDGQPPLGIDRSNAKLSRTSAALDGDLADVKVDLAVVLGERSGVTEEEVRRARVALDSVHGRCLKRDLRCCCHRRRRSLAGRVGLRRRWGRTGWRGGQG
jgi:hypothetical protein